MEIHFKRYYETAIVPLRATSGSAGYDLFSSMNKLIKSHSYDLIRTNLILKIPTGFYGQISGRSGLAPKYSIAAHNGVVDSDCRGVVCAVLFSNSDKDYQVLSGQLIDQIILSETETIKFIKLSQIDKIKRD